jgi:hypothetical protein
MLLKSIKKTRGKIYEKEKNICFLIVPSRAQLKKIMCWTI